MCQRTLIRWISLSVWSLVACGCAYEVSAERKMSAQKVGTDYATLSGYMRATNGFEENTPGNIRHAVIIDEAQLVKLEKRRTCFQTTVRTGSRTDEPIAKLEPRCVLDGNREVDAVPRDETLRIVDYGYRGYENKVVAEGVAAGEYMGLQLSAPTEKTFRVIERRATLCCPGTPSSSVELLMVNDRMGINNPYGVRFVWKLR